MKIGRLILLILLYSSCANKSFAQAPTDSLLPVSARSLTAISSKADKYYDRISSKTEKTLEKLSHWENKIKSLLEKASPNAAQRLFAPGHPTFASMLEKFRQGKAAGDGYRQRYDEYRDKLTNSLNYLQSNQVIVKEGLRQPLLQAKDKVDKLTAQVDNTEAVEQFVRERKKELLQEAVQYIGNSKYLGKINKESYYYLETMRNYKELFSDAGKAEQTTLNLLEKIPAFNDFLRKNSMLAAILHMQGDMNDPVTQANLTGLQTRSQVTNFIQQQVAAGGPNALQQVQENLQAAQSQLDQLKDKVMNRLGGNSSDIDMPGDFAPNTLKSKTLLQRIELGTNVQSQRHQGILPATSEIALNAGYRLSEKSTIGLAGVYRMGWGQDINHIKFSHEGVGIRSYADIKLKKSFWISGGYEMNYRSAFNRLEQLKQYDAWQRSCLLGISKIVDMKSKFFKKTKLQLLYNFLSNQQVPKATPVVFRMGYTF